MNSKGNGIITRRRRPLAITSAAAITVLLALPVGSPGLKVGGIDVDQVTGGVTKSLGIGQPASSPSSSQQASQRSGVPPSYQPPLHGTNPHGEGSVATLELAPTQSNPYVSPPVSGPETIVVGRSRGEQNPDGSYHGHITIVGLFGNEVLGVDTTNGQQSGGPFDPLNSGLAPLCNGTSTQICLGLLQANSATNATGSQNSFSIASAQLGDPASGIGVTAGQSSGNISQTPTCQTASGSSSTATANIGGAITAGVDQDSSTSTACNDGTAPSTTNSSSVLTLNGMGIPIPAAGCDNGTPNTNFVALSPLIATVCNADDPGTGGQANGGTYGVREALAVFTLISGTTPTIKLTDAAESRVLAPSATAPPANPGSPLIGPGGGNNPKKTVNKANVPGAVATAAEPGGRDNLAFTGQDLLLIALFGTGILAAGSMLALATRRVHA